MRYRFGSPAPHSVLLHNTNGTGQVLPGQHLGAAPDNRPVCQNKLLKGPGTVNPFSVEDFIELNIFWVRFPGFEAD